jgi:hypothetical protein
MGSVCSSFSTPAPKSDKSKGFGGSVSDLPKNSAVDTLLMDLGVKEKNVQYGRDLADRQARANAANAEMMKSDNNDSSAPAATVTDTTTTTTTDTAADTTTTLDTATDTDLTEVETISETTFGGGDFTGNAGSGASVGTAAGGDAQATAASATSVGAAEDEAIDLMKKGRRSTILTTPGGLLGGGEEEDKKTRRRRSLIG